MFKTKFKKEFIDNNKNQRHLFMIELIKDCGYSELHSSCFVTCQKDREEGEEE